MTDTAGAVVQQFTYDPWGKQTKIYQKSTFADLIYNQPTNRGYTGHEHIRDLDIIHMNGRIYDADLGRFLQADPNIQAVGNFQNYNRYSYVLNNPLSMTDPSGFFFKKLFKAVKKYWKQIASIALTAIAGPLGTFIGNYLMTGSLRGALIGAISGAIGFGLGGLDGVAGFLANGAIGGVMSKLQGGNFGRGFMSAGIGNALGGMMKGVKSNWGKVLASAVVGGTVSRISGGKFGNGAFSSAFATALKLDWGKKQTKRSIGDNNGEKPKRKKSTSDDELLEKTVEELRRIGDFTKAEESARLGNKGKPITYEWTDGESSTDNGVVYISRAWRSTAYNADLGDFEEACCGHLSGDKYFEALTNFENSLDVSANNKGIQLPFSLERIIVHELYHNTLHFGHAEISAISLTNNFMSKHFGEYNRTDHRLFYY